MATTKSRTRTQDVKRLAKILRDGDYSYDQSKHLVAKARREVGLLPPKRKKGAVERLTVEEVEKLLEAAYRTSGARGLMLRTLLETGSRVAAFTKLRVEEISLNELELRITDKGTKARDVPILKSLAQELRLHLGDRQSGYLFPSPRGGPYSSRRLQQIVKELAGDAGIQKNVYPHLLRHTIAQRLADRGMPENLLQRFLGHENPQTTQIYYEPDRRQVKQAFQQAMKSP